MGPTTAGGRAPRGSIVAGPCQSADFATAKRWAESNVNTETFPGSTRFPGSFGQEENLNPPVEANGYFDRFRAIYVDIDSGR